MENTNPNLPENNEEQVNLGTLDPKADLIRNKNLFKKSLIFAGSFVVILLAVLAWQYFGNRSAQTKINKADTALLTANDSTQYAQALAAYDKAANDGSYAANMRAKLMAATNKYTEGQYEAAIKVLDGFSSKSTVANVGAYCLRGDCYVNLDKNEKAVSEFETALKEAGNNPELAPYVLNKLANVYHVMGNAAKEKEVLTKLQKDYPAYDPTVEARIARVK